MYKQINKQMKKFLLAMAAVAAFAFVGCQKDNSSDETGSLEGTVWEGTEYEEGEMFTFRIEFKSGSKVVVSEIYVDESFSYNGTYSVDGSVVTMDIDDGDDDYSDDDEWIIIGKISGTTMKVYSDGSYLMDIYKK